MQEHLQEKHFIIGYHCSTRDNLFWETVNVTWQSTDKKITQGNNDKGKQTTCSKMDSLES